MTSRGPALSRPLTNRGLWGRRVLKRSLYALLSIWQALMVALGRDQPLVRFTVEADPPSVYLVYRIRAEAIESLPTVLGLAPTLVPTPIRCLVDDQPEYLMVLNYYRVSGLSTGLRAEWSTFIRDADGVARYLVFDACSAEFSIDPIDIATRRGPIEHRRDGATITSVIGEQETSYSCTIEMPDAPARRLVKTAAEWANANDYIYWTNGICDRTFYDAGMHDPLVARVPLDQVTIIDNTPWAEIVEPLPVHVLVFERAIELAMSPWQNLDRISARN